MVKDILRILRLVAGDMPLHGGTLDASMQDYWHRRAETDTLIERRKARIARRMEAVAQEIQDGESVLEIGCGAGDLLEVIRRRHPTCRLQGLDLSEEAVEAGRAKGFDVWKADVLELDTDAMDPVDVVVLSEVLEHLPDPEKVLLACGRLARKRIVVTIPNVAFFLHRIRLGLFGKFPVTTVFHIREHLSLWSCSDFHYWAQALGFRVAASRGLGGVEVLSLHQVWPNMMANQMLYVLVPGEAGRS